jgi:hypothetical protein
VRSWFMMGGDSAICQPGTITRFVEAVHSLRCVRRPATTSTFQIWRMSASGSSGQGPLRRCRSWRILIVSIRETRLTRTPSVLPALPVYQYILEHRLYKDDQPNYTK